MREKAIAGVLIACTLLFFFIQASNSPAPSSQSWFAEIPYSESKEIFAALGGSPSARPVVVFETDWCPVCRAVRSELDRKSIPHIAVNVEKNETAKLIYSKLLAGRQGGIPLTLIGSKAVLGYRIALIDTAYAELKNQHL